jgi:hypothetical protein
MRIEDRREGSLRAGRLGRAQEHVVAIIINFLEQT